MSLQDWAKNGWLRPHVTSQQEISGLLAIVDRDLADTSSGISADWKFGIAYNAALKLCTILLFASGYRPEKGSLAHYRSLAALSLILGERHKENADYLDTCRTKRNTAEYEMAGVATMKDAAELISFTRELREEVLGWLTGNQPGLLRAR